MAYVAWFLLGLLWPSVNLIAAYVVISFIKGDYK